MLTPVANSPSVEGFPSQPLTLKQVQYSGILESIPKKPSQGSVASEVSDSCEICKALIDIGYDIRLGEAGRATLKREISRRLKESVQLRDLCVNQVCRLKNANVLQLIQMSELTGCLLLALRISSAYWKDYNRKQTTGAGAANGSQSTTTGKGDTRPRLRGTRRKSASPFPTLEPPQDGPNEQYFPELEFSSSPEASGASASASPSPVWTKLNMRQDVKGEETADILPPLQYVSLQSLKELEDDDLSSAPRPRRRRRRSSPSCGTSVRQRKRGRPRKTARERQDAPWKPRRSSVRYEGLDEAESDSARSLRGSLTRRRATCPLLTNDASYLHQMTEATQQNRDEVCEEDGVDQLTYNSAKMSPVLDREASSSPDAEAEILIVPPKLEAQCDYFNEPYSLESLSTTESIQSVDLLQDKMKKRKLIDPPSETTLSLSEVSSRVVQRRVDFNGWRMTVSCMKTSPSL